MYDITGKKYGKLTAVKFHHKKIKLYKKTQKSYKYFWVFLCDCGKEVIRIRSNISCFICNNAKRNLSLKDFYSWINRLKEHNKVN